MFSILVADNSVLMREGFKSLVQRSFQVELNEVSEKSELLAALKKHRPRMLVIDPITLQLLPSDIAQIKKQYGSLQILAISSMLNREEYSLYLNAGITSYLLKELYLITHNSD